MGTQRISYVIATDEEDALRYGLYTIKDAMEGVHPDHKCNCTNCHYKGRKVFKIKTKILEEVPYQDPSTFEQDTPDEYPDHD